MVMIVGTSLKISGATKINLNEDSNAANNGQLITEARNDPAAFGRLYRRHYDAVFRYCVHRLFERQAAEDVTSAVFLKVVAKFRDFKGDEQQFRNWLYRIATNEVNNHLRRARQRGRLLKFAGERLSTPMADCHVSTNESAEILALLKEAMLTLKPRYQTIITLRFFENLKLTEIAEVLGSNPGTVRSQLARALAKLRKKIGPALQEISK
ncbi:MAG: RNA polymerase sigma factor [Planctomycetota bacterium]|jgi:RNA polymerase sigma-70 factor (ECF subfamily)